MSRKGFVFVRHKVKDFDYWRPFFVGDGKRQKRAKFTKWRIGRSIADRNDIIVVFECDDLDKALKVYSDPEVAKIVKKAGVIGKTTFLLVEDIESRKLSR